MNNVANKKDFFYIIVLILTFITAIVGATFALYTFIFSQKEGSSAVYTGTLSIEYLSGEIISFNLLYPTEKPSMGTEKNVYKNNFKGNKFLYLMRLIFPTFKYMKARNNILKKWPVLLPYFYMERICVAVFKKKKLAVQSIKGLENYNADKAKEIQELHENSGI